MDADAYRSRSRASGGSAPLLAWQARAALRSRPAALPVSHRMVDAIDPQPGHAVLELAAGPGDTGLLAAELAASLAGG